MLYIVQLMVNPTTSNVFRIIQLSQVKRDVVNTGFPKESEGIQGAKKVIACNSGKLKLAFTSPFNIISTSPKKVLMSRLISQFFCNLNSSKKFTCLSGKLITDFTSPIAKSTSPGLSDTTFSAR